MKTLVVIWFSLMVFASTHAQSIVAKLSHTTVRVNQNFQLSFEIKGSATHFTPPTLDEFTVLSGPNKSTSMQWINGVHSSSITYSYILRAAKEGQFEIDPATIKSNGKSISSNTLKINVVGANNANPKDQNSNAPQNAAEDELSSNLFMKLFVDKKQIYVGEQITATYKLYINTQIVNYAFSRPSFDGFFAHELDIKPEGEISNEVINGKNFQVATIKRVLLTAQKPGKIEIPALEGEFIARIQEPRRSRTLYEQMFGTHRDIKTAMESNGEVINVLPLPTMDKPSNFSGAVGEISISAKTDREEVLTNEAITLQINLTGKGNIDLATQPTATFPADFEVYDPKSRSNINHTAGGSSGEKTFEYVIIPRYAGEFEIKPIAYSYFDPRSKSYKTVQTQAIKLKVMPAEGGSSGGELSYMLPRKEDVQIIGKDIRFIKTDHANLQRREQAFFRSNLFYALSVVPIGGMVCAIYLIGLFRERNSDESRIKQNRAGAVAKKHLSKAGKMMADNDASCYQEISEALFGYISNKLGIPLAELSRERIELEFKTRNVNIDLYQRLSKALDECEMVRFAPGVVRGKNEMLAASQSIIEALEDEL